jgi:hypothetical protein
MTSNGVRDAPRDYGTGLILFGILDVVVGALYLAKTVVFFVLSFAAGASLARPDRTEVVAAAIVAFPAAIFFLSVGFGSMAARRWARSLSVAFSAVWLAAGGATAAFLFACLPRVFAALRPLEGARPAPFAHDLRAYFLVAVVGLVLPAAYFLFYRSAGLRAECERRDPDPRWTDRVPARSLAAAFVLAVGAILAFAFAFSTSRQFLFFGTILSGPIRAATLVASAVQALAAWGICRGDLRAWPAGVAVMGIRAAANTAIARRLAGTSLASLAARAGPLPPESRAAVERLDSLHSVGAAAGFFSALSIGAFVFVAWAGFRAARDSRRVPDAR